MFTKVSLLSALISAASAGEMIWDGRFNDMTSSADLEKWSFSNPVGAYQYYIHGSGDVADYVNLDASYKNPADTGSKKGVKITIDDTSRWNGQTMLRTELIPETKAAINEGKVYYHFSVKTAAENAPTTANEHQVAFFESHFTELKYGGDAKNNLQWHVGGQSKWDVELVADEWHNVAYEIDFDAKSVAFWHSTGSDALKKTAGPFDASTSSNGADWHLGVLRLPGSSDAKGAEDWYFSGVYVESGELTTSVNTPGGSADAEKPAAAEPAASKPASSASAAAPTSSTVASVVESSAAASSTAVAAETPASSAAVETPVASSTSAVAETPVASSSAVAETPVASSSAAAVETPAVSSTPTVEIPVASPTSTGRPGSDAVLPKEFTIKQFIAWLKAKQGRA